MAHWVFKWNFNVHQSVFNEVPPVSPQNGELNKHLLSNRARFNLAQKIEHSTFDVWNLYLDELRNRCLRMINCVINELDEARVR